VIAAAAIIGGTANGIAYSNHGRSFFEGFAKGAVVGGAAALTGGAIAGAIPGFGGAVLGGMAGGIVNGGLGSAFNGGDIAQGVMFGAMTGVVGGGLGSYFGGGTGALIGGAASGALGSALNGGNILTGALVGGVSSFGIYHGLNYYTYLNSSFKTMGVRYVDFARMGGDYQRSLARHKEFGGIVTTKGYYRVPSSERHNLGFSITDKWVEPDKIEGDILFTFHTHWAKAGEINFSNNNADILYDPADKFRSLLNHGIHDLGTTVYGPSPDDIGTAASFRWMGILSDRSGIYQYTGTWATCTLDRTSLLRYNFIYWPW
jgi:hypothetical protein